MKKTILLVLILVLGLATEITNADFIFGNPQNLGPVINSPSSDYGACVSVDGLELYFCSERPGGFGAADIWVSTRQSIDDPWGPPTNLGSTVNSSYSDSYPSLSSDGLTLVFTSNNRAGGIGSWDLWMSTRVSVEDPWGPLVNLGTTVNSGAWDGECGLSWDGRAVLYDSGRIGIVGAVDMWMSTRNTLADPWAVAVNLGPVVNSSSDDGTPKISSDMRTLYFNSNRPGGFGSYDLFEAPIILLVDFSGDGIVDVKDVVIMTEHWGENYPLCDIGPMPWGDGIVDIQDLVVLTEYIEPLDLTLVAHWAFDEIEGMFAADSAGDNDAFVDGGTVWQPSSGQVDGALQLDGIDGCAIAGFVLNPGKGPLSAFAWINGGAPGQVVVSQQGTANWLAADAKGNLITELKGAGRSGSPMISQTNITDGNWHRIGLVWDGSHRTLYVDSIVVAEDVQNGLEASINGLYIGTGMAMEPGTYFSGLIDDIRIYKRAVTP